MRTPHSAGKPVPVLALYHRAETFGGSFNSVVDVLGRVDRTRFAPLAAVPGPGNCNDRFRSMGLPVLFASESPGSRTPGYALSVASFAWQLQRNGIKLVYVSDYVTWRSSALLAARVAGVPSVVHVRAPLGNGVLDPELGHATIVIGNSEASIRALRTHRSAEHVRVVHNFIDVEPFDRARDIRGQFFEGGGPVVGFVGVFRPEKGIEYFLDMARILLERNPHVRFLAVGGESAVEDIGWFDRMRAHANAIGLGDRIHFTGSRTDIPDVMRSIDVLVVPSVNEGFGRVIVEANAVGVPAVGADAAGIPEVIEDGVTGYLAPPRDAPAMATAVARILADEGLRQRLRETLPERVRTRFAPATQMALLQQAWTDALDYSKRA
jgi:glycosyltransferase involved in cell wall biosynthesis